MKDEHYIMIEELRNYIEEYDKVYCQPELVFDEAKMQQSMPVLVDEEDMEKIKNVVRLFHRRRLSEHKSYLYRNATTASNAARRVLEMVKEVTGTDTGLPKMNTDTSILLAYAKGLETRVEVLRAAGNSVDSFKADVLEQLVREIQDAEAKI